MEHYEEPAAPESPSVQLLNYIADNGLALESLDPTTLAAFREARKRHPSLVATSSVAGSISDLSRVATDVLARADPHDWPRHALEAKMHSTWDQWARSAENAGGRAGARPAFAGWPDRVPPSPGMGESALSPGMPGTFGDARAAGPGGGAAAGTGAGTGGGGAGGAGGAGAGGAAERATPANLEAIAALARSDWASTNQAAMAETIQQILAKKQPGPQTAHHVAPAAFSAGSAQLGGALHSPVRAHVQSAPQHRRAYSYAGGFATPGRHATMEELEMAVQDSPLGNRFAPGAGRPRPPPIVPTTPPQRLPRAAVLATAPLHRNDHDNDNDNNNAASSLEAQFQASLSRWRSHMSAALAEDAFMKECISRALELRAVQPLPATPVAGMEGRKNDAAADDTEATIALVADLLGRVGLGVAATKKKVRVNEVAEEEGEEDEEEDGHETVTEEGEKKKKKRKQKRKQKSKKAKKDEDSDEEEPERRRDKGKAAVVAGPSHAEA